MTRKESSPRRVLIVSPRFAPSNAADSHRVRQSLPHFAEFGWQPTVLAVESRYCDAPTDRKLEETIPPNVRVIRTRAISQRGAARFRIGAFDLRALPYLAAAGARLLDGERFDLVYFSTTAFSALALGRLWRTRFRAPFVIDLQDPWRNDYYSRPGAPPPPGGRVKYGMAAALARLLEPLTMRRVGHVISVSPAYPRMLMERYPWMRDDQFTVLPFAASNLDYDLLRRAPVSQRVFQRDDGYQHWVYTGVTPPSMSLALRGFFKAVQDARVEEPRRFERVRIHFIGTSYASPDRATSSVLSIAAAFGVSDLVTEHPARVPYFEALQCVLDADALLVPGSDDAGYTASKLHPYLLAQKPLLAIVHAKSGMVDMMRELGGAAVVTFTGADSPDDIARGVARAWFSADAPRAAPLDLIAFEKYTAREMTRRQCEIFDRIAGAT